MDPPDKPPKISLRDALSRKRNSLDQEIEHFKALKESEFRAYEEELRTQVEDQQGISTTIKANDTEPIVERGFRPNGTTRPMTTNKNTSPFGTQQSLSKHSTLFQSLTASKQDQSSNPMPVPGGDGSGKEEREMELRSLFPSFLPLLENPQSHSSTSQSRYSHRKSLSAQLNLSSSLTMLPSTTYGGHSPVQSSSAPRPSLGNRRSSSSPTGGSLRSSLRQPKSPEQGPREAKHVLFSIDNVVMSPSSSPEIRRGEHGKRSKKRGITSSARKATNSIDLKGTDGQDNDIIAFPKNISVAQPLPVSPTPYPRSYKELIEPTITPPSKALNAEDFEIGGGDPLFDFEDDVKSESRIDDDEGDLQQKRQEPAKGPEEDAGLAVSPHAGSLPIEIRWPGRRA